LATDTAIFGSTGNSSSSTTVNNVVDSGYAGTIENLTYNSTSPTAYNVTQLTNTLTVTGTLLVGGQSGVGYTTEAFFTGGGSLVVEGTNLVVQNYGSASGANSTAYLNLTNLDGFTYNNNTGTFSIADVNSGGFTRTAGNVLLAATNTITASIINIGTSTAAQAGPASSLTLGATNTINVATFNIVNQKSSGTVSFLTPGSGLYLRGVSGANIDRANIIVGNRNISGSGTTSGTLALDGSYVDIKAGSLIVGENSGGSVAAAAGLVQFDTGILDATSISIASSVSGSSNVSGAITVGTNGTLVIGSGGLSLVDEASGSVASVGGVTGTLTINGGTVTGNGNITEGSTLASGAILFSNGGTLNMGAGNYIGTTALPINSFTLNNGATLGLSVGSSGQAPAVVGTLTWPANDNTLTIDITSLPAGAKAGSNYTLISYTTFSGTFSAPIVELPPGISGTLSQSANSIILTIASGGGAGFGGVNQLANPGFETPNKAGWTTVGNTPVITVGTATYDNSTTGACPQDTVAELVVSYTGSNVANMYGAFSGNANTNSWSQTLSAAPGSTWTAGSFTYVSHEDLMSGKNSFYYQVNFRDENGVLLASYQSFILTNLTCGETTPFPLDTWVLLGVTNQMQVTAGVNTGAVTGTDPTGVLTAPPETVSVQFEAIFIQQGPPDQYDGGSVYLDDANLALLSGSVPPTMTAVTPNLITLCTNTALTCTASSSASIITNVQVTVLSGVLGGSTNTTIYNLSSNQLSVAGIDTSTANISLALTTNVVYHSVTVKATDGNGVNVVSAPVSFDTLYPTLVIEASDFNFTTNGVSGGFIDTPENGGLDLYVNRVGTEGIDEHKQTGSGSQANKDAYYRPTDAVIVGDASPISGPSATEQKFITAAADGLTNDQELEIGYNSVGDWLNYTRTFGPGGSAPAGTYNVWCYLATDGSGVQATFAQVTNNATQTGQLTNILGNIGATSFSDTGWNNYEYVPLVDQFGNLVSITVGAGEQTFRSTIVNNPNLGFYMLMPVTPVLTPTLQYAYPDGLHPFEYTNKLAFTVGPANGASIASSGIQLILNGIDVSAAATKTESGGSWTVTYPLSLNAVYSAVINVTNTSSLSSSFPISFDTFNVTNYQFETVDYDFTLNGTSALFIDYPIPSCDVTTPPNGHPATNSYYGYPTDVYGAVATQGVDINFPNDGQNAANEIYRNDGVGSQAATDWLRPKFTNAQAVFGDPNIGPVNIGYFGAGYWLNFTRTWPTNNYYVWGRLAGGAGAYSGTTLSIVTNGVGTATQMTNVLGTFADPNASGWQAYHWVPLLTNNGAMAIVPLGGVETLKLTSGNNLNTEFLMLVPAPSEPKLTVSVVAGQLNISIPTQIGYNYTVYYSPTLTSPNWQPVGLTITGDGTTHVVTELMSGLQGYYKVE
jgi:hypothetical protein